MARNADSFSINPVSVNISRSKFPRNSGVKFTGNVGDLIPFYIDEVLPGDTFNVKTSKVVRLQTPVTPFMDNLFLDTYYFFVPNRLVWEHWKQFMGENTESAWIPTTEYSIPQTKIPVQGFPTGSIADYFGIPAEVGVPVGSTGATVSSLPFRAYALICDEWFRDQNLSDPLNISKGDATSDPDVSATGSYITDVELGLSPFKAAKLHDYFSSCLPAPQKHSDVTIGLGVNQFAPVYPRSATISDDLTGIVTQSFKLTNNRTFGEETDARPLGINPNSNDLHRGFLKTENDTGTTGGFDWSLYPDNLWADLGAGGFTTINQLRTAFQLQKLFERDARGGTRYTEIIRSHFGVSSPDARLQRPEYLGGNRLPLVVSQVVQSSSDTESQRLGSTGAVSLTNDFHNDFTRSFTEHGLIIGVAVVRYRHTYAQGLERFWNRTTRFDFYYPVLANVGEQPVFKREIFFDGTDDQSVFGYQEAWADYRYKPSRLAGEMRPYVSNNLGSWSFADDYEQKPTLSDEWIREDFHNVDRVLGVQSSVSNQFLCDFYIYNDTTRPMPLYSIPGFLDHN